MVEAWPNIPGTVGGSAAERRVSGGLGAKQFDCTWATEEGGLLLAVSVKTINFHDIKTHNFQKNLTNRRNDLLIEALTLHKRFPYAVISGFLFLDKDAATDATPRRHSTFVNAHARMRILTNRPDPAAWGEQYERLYIVLLNANLFASNFRVFHVGEADTEVPLAQAFNDLVGLITDRNPDFYEDFAGELRKVAG